MTPVHDEDGTVLGGVGDEMDLPLIDAARLHELRGCEAIAGVPLPDGSLPITGRWRMTQDEWARYRAACGWAATWQPPVGTDPPCCACPAFLFFAADLAEMQPAPEWLVIAALFTVAATVLWLLAAEVGPFEGE